MSSGHSITQKIANYLPFFRSRQQVTRKEALSARPIRNTLVRWEKTEEGEVKLFVPMRKDRMARVLGRIFKVPDRDKQIILDEIGGAVWEMCDGKNDINSIITALARQHKLARREAEVSVTAFLKMLAQRNLISLALGGRKSGSRS